MNSELEQLDICMCGSAAGYPHKPDCPRPMFRGSDDQAKAWSVEREQLRESNLAHHQCERGESWAEYDAQGIYLCRVCPKCRKAKLSRYRPEILTGYSQADVDEPIEPD